MAYKHLRRDKSGKYIHTGIFKDADEERVKDAVKAYRKLRIARAFRDDEGRITFYRPLTRMAFGVVAGAVVSGGAASLLGAAPDSGLWFGAKAGWQAIVNNHPELVGAFVIEMAGLMAFEGLAKNQKDRAGKRKFEKYWKKQKFTNDELIHVFTRENKLDPSYSSGDLMFFEKNPVPQSLIPTVKRPDGTRDPVKWTRFRRTGEFRLVVGEEYEMDGRFNAEPKITSIPPLGAYLGICVLGPTGSGKSQSVLLPFLDQGAGYYSWVDSERDEWLFNAPSNIAKLRRLAGMVKNAGKRSEYLRLADELDNNYNKWIEDIEKGVDPSTGYQKIGIFLVEPKAEMFLDMRALLKKYSREKDYLELGIVKAKFEAYSKYSQRLESVSRGLWGYATESHLVDRGGESLSRFCSTFAIQRIPNPQEAMQAVYGQDYLQNFHANPTRQTHGHNEQIAHSTDWHSPDPQIGGYCQAMVSQCDTVFSPWCFAGGWIDSENAYVGPFGFGTKNDPWAMRYLGNLTDSRYENAQGYFISTVETWNGVFSTLALRFDELDGRGMVDITEQNPLRNTRAEENDDLNTRARVVGMLSGASSGLKRRFDRDGEEFMLGRTIVPVLPPTAMLRPAASSGDGDAKKSGPGDRIKEGLSLAPMDRTEFSKLRKRMRAVVPINRIPGEWRDSYRMRLAMWKANRRVNQFYFIKELVDGMDPERDLVQKKYRERMDQVFLQGGFGGSFAGIVTGLLVQQYPLALFEGLTSYLVNHGDGPGIGETGDVVRTGDLIGERSESLFGFMEANGWSVFRNVELEHVTYDALTSYALRPTEQLVEKLCSENSIKYAEGWFEDLIGHLEFRKVLAARRDATVGAWAMNQDASKVAGPSSLGDLIRSLQTGIAKIIIGEPGKTTSSSVLKWLRFLNPDRERILAHFAGQADAEACAHEAMTSKITIEDMMQVITELRAEAKRTNMLYDIDPKIPSGDALSEDPEEYEAIVDTSAFEIALGPWDAVWSEVVGERLWEPMRDAVRRTLAKAMAHCGAKESDLLRTVEEQGAHAANLKGVMGVVERQLAQRRDEVNREILNYFSQVEEYLRTLSPYYKSNVPFAYGFKDSAISPANGLPIGTGDCDGANKYNPVHIPSMTPDQLSSALIGALTKNAGEGDTDVFKNAAKKMATNFISILRVAKGYITVSDILQMVSSDAFVDLMIKLADKRIRAMELQQGGSGNIQEVRDGAVMNKWREFIGWDSGEVSEQGDESSDWDRADVPGELRWLLPRMASEYELSMARGLLDKGKAFVIQEWRNPKGEFASDEMRGNAKQTFSQLDPLLTGIGSYSFCPDDPEEISFPSWDEIRTLGLCVVTRFNMTTDPNLGGLVTGMAITSYQMTVMQAKENQTEAKILFQSVMGKLDRSRDELDRVRREYRALAKVGVGRRARKAEVNRAALRILGEMIRGGQKGQPPTVVGHQLVDAIWKCAGEGLEIDGRLLLDHVDAFQIAGSASSESGQVRGRMAMAAGGGMDWERQVLAEAQVAFRARCARAAEEETIRLDKMNRLQKQSWEIRQEILNGLARLEMFPDFSRYMLFVIDEYQMYRNFQKKSGGLSDEVFLSASRAGRSFNVFCTQSPASVKSGVSNDAFMQWLGNIRNRIVLGAPTKEDAELVSDLFGARELEVEKEGGFTVNYSGVDIGGGGAVRAAKSEGGSKNYSLSIEDVKYVKPTDLSQMRAMSSYVQLTDGQSPSEPKLVYHVPNFLLSSDKVSPITGEPLCLKTWVGLVRDGELDLIPPEDSNLRRLMENLQSVGVDMERELAEFEDRKRKLEASA